MERWDYKSLKHGQYRSTSREKEQQYPSFSSTLLDSIYRSIDETSGEISATEATMRNKKQVCSKDEDVANYKRACLIEKWMEKKKLASTTTTTIVRQKSTADFHSVSTQSTSGATSTTKRMMNLSSSSNSDSSFSGGLSSSEAESNNYNASCDFKFHHKPKPIRTTSHHQSEAWRKKHESSSSCDRQVENLPRQKMKNESFTSNTSNNSHSSSTTTTGSNNVATKTKKLTRALKIYNDLKKTKQPISPGGRLASFINSLFTSGNSKKANSDNISRSTTQFDAKSPYSSNCSSASSFSRSCLSKGSLNNNNNGAAGAKRSVRFYPVSVIVDEDCRPCGQKSLREDHHQIVKQQKARNVDFDMKFVTEAFDGDGDGDDEDDDDDASCTSSDLFELDNLGSIGMDCYREELPVYETTRFELNRVISKGLIV